jgi:hypothetical protein
VGLKLIGAGLGRTGTLSLKLALEDLLGGPCYHMIEVRERPEDPDLWGDAYEGKLPARQHHCSSQSRTGARFFPLIGLGSVAHGLLKFGSFDSFRSNSPPSTHVRHEGAVALQSANH